MDACELAELIRTIVDNDAARSDVDVETRGGTGEADFFLTVEDEGTFVVAVIKVSE